MLKLKPSLSLHSQDLPLSRPLPSSPEAVLLRSALRSPSGTGVRSGPFPFWGSREACPCGPSANSQDRPGDATVSTPALRAWRAGSRLPAVMRGEPREESVLSRAGVGRAAGVEHTDLPPGMERSSCSLKAGDPALADSTPSSLDPLKV